MKVLADASSAIAASTFSVGGTYRVTGIVGQRATRTGALDGYRICLRDAATSPWSRPRRPPRRPPRAAADAQADRIGVRERPGRPADHDRRGEAHERPIGRRSWPS